MLSDIDPQHPCANTISEFTLLEREFINFTRELVDCITTDSSISRIHLVASCIEGSPEGQRSDQHLYIDL